MSVIAIASLLAAQAPATLLYQPKVGSSFKYAVTMDNNTQMGNSKLTLTNTMKILSASGGLYKVQSSNSNTKMTGGMGANTPKDSSMTMTIDKYGNIKMDAKGGGALGAMFGGNDNSPVGLMFPKKPVKVGDTWTSSVDMGAMMAGAMKASPQAKNTKATGMLNMNFKLNKLDGTVAGITCTFSGTVNMSTMGASPKGGAPQAMNMTMKMSGTSNYTIERPTGMVMSAITKTSMDMSVMGQQMKMSQSFTQKRI